MWQYGLREIPQRSGMEGNQRCWIRLGRYNAKGLEEAEVHWPGKGGKTKGGKIWKCVMLPPDQEEEATLQRPSQGPATPRKGALLR